MYDVYVPHRLPRGAVPLVVVLHGCDQSPEEVAAGTRLNALADRAGFVAVYPEQGGHHNSGRCWNWFRPQHQARDAGEPAAIVEIIQRLLPDGTRAVIDPARVYVLGMSAGGAMASILAATYPDVFAAVGIHSGLQYAAARNLPSALLAMRRGGPDPHLQGGLAYAAMGRQARVVPAMVVHGDHDTSVWAGNGEQVVRQWLATARLASRGLLRPDFARPDISHAGRSPGQLPYWVRAWNDLSGRPIVEYWSVSGLGHAWSGGAGAVYYTDPRGPDATEGMYRFLSQHRLGADPSWTKPTSWFRRRAA
jgi:poly(hydroxyalkanoate) depolymerase family esterase